MTYGKTQYLADIQALLDDKKAQAVTYATNNAQTTSTGSSGEVQIGDYYFSSQADADVYQAMLDTITNLEKKYTETAQTYSEIESNQSSMINIIDQEKRRLNSKKELVDSSLFEQKRLQTLNNSYRHRYNYYIYVIVAIIMLLLSIIIISRLSNTFTFIPSVVYDMLYIAAFVSVGFYIYFTYLEIRRRDHMDFTKVAAAAPKYKTPAELEQERNENIRNGNLIPAFCVGSQCCNEGTEWDSVLGKCKAPSDVFTNYDFIYKPAELVYGKFDNKELEAANNVDNFEYV